MAEPLSPEERDALAAEMALGVLEGEERAQALRLQLADGDFRADVMAWEARFAPLLATVADVAPPDLWPAIERRLGLAEGTSDGAQLQMLALGRRVMAWRIGALASGAIAAGLALMLVLRPVPPAPAPVPAPSAVRQAIVAQLGTSGDAAQLVADYDPAHGELRIRAIQLPQSKLSPELWVIPAGGAPRSLGLLAARGASTVSVSDALRAAMKDGATLAVTLEPRKGAPHSAPSSTPIAAGTLHKI